MYFERLTFAYCLMSEQAPVSNTNPNTDSSGIDLLRTIYACKTEGVMLSVCKLPNLFFFGGGDDF